MAERPDIDLDDLERPCVLAGVDSGRENPAGVRQDCIVCGQPSADRLAFAPACKEHARPDVLALRLEWLAAERDVALRRWEDVARQRDELRQRLDAAERTATEWRAVAEQWERTAADTARENNA